MPIQVRRFDAAGAVPMEGEGVANVKHVPVSESSSSRVTTLYFGAKGEIGRRELPYDILLMVLEGNGRLRLGGEVREVTAGEAVLLPANQLHMMWTSDTPMTALTVEFRD